MKLVGIDRIFRAPRLWSNIELRRIAPLFTGDVINVSAWRDEDKEGGTYRDYFSNSRSYTISNWHSERGYQNSAGEVLLNLEDPLPTELSQQYDVVFNHTTLEHVPDIWTAFANLCELSRDVVIVVVPFFQQLHFSPGYLDYWRMTPHALQFLFKNNGLTPVYSAMNRQSNASIYTISVGTRFPERWQEKFGDADSDWLGVGGETVRNDALGVASTYVYTRLRQLRRRLFENGESS